MVSSNDRARGGRGGSLLSLSRAIEEERARVGIATPKNAHPDAVERHRRARELREAQSGAASETSEKSVSKPVPAQADAGTLRAAKQQPEVRPSETPRPRVTIHQRPAVDGSKAAAPAPEPTIAVSVAKPPLDSAPREPAGEYDARSADSRRDDDGWQPLIDPVRVIGGIMNSKALILATTMLGAAAGVGLALQTPKMYDAYAEILVDPRDLKIVDRDLTDVAGLPSDATIAIVENQARILTSSVVLSDVVKALKLDEDTEFNGQADGISMNPITFVRSLLTRSDEGALDRSAVAERNLSKSLEVERTGKTFVIVIKARTENPQLSANIANTLIEKYRARSGAIQSETATRANEELTNGVNALRTEVEAAERKVEAFKAENDIIDAQGRLITDDEILKLNDQLAVSKARSLELNARAESTRSVDADSVIAGATPEAAASGVITELRAQYATAKQEMDRLAVRLGPRHPQIQAAGAQLEGIREQISAELRRINQQVQTELRRAVQLEQELAARLAQLKVRQGDLSSEMVVLRELERDATAKRSVYEAFLQRARETGEQKSINTANITTINPAQPPMESAGPSRIGIVALGTMLGLLLGIGIGGLRGAAASLRERAGDRPRVLRRPYVERLTDTVDAPRISAQDAVATASSEATAVRQTSPISPASPVAAAPPPSRPVARDAKRAPTPSNPSPNKKEDRSMSWNPIYPSQQPYPQHGSQPVVPQRQYGAYPQPASHQPPAFQPVPMQQQASYPYGYQQPSAPPPHYHALPQPQTWAPPPPAFHRQPAPPAQAGYAATAPASYPYAGYTPAAGQYGPEQMPASAHALPRQPDSLTEIRDSIREFRAAVQELIEGRQRRRYF